MELLGNSVSQSRIIKFKMYLQCVNNFVRCLKDTETIMYANDTDLLLQGKCVDKLSNVES